MRKNEGAKGIVRRRTPAQGLFRWWSRRRIRRARRHAGAWRSCWVTTYGWWSTPRCTRVRWRGCWRWWVGDDSGSGRGSGRGSRCRLAPAAAVPGCRSGDRQLRLARITRWERWGASRSRRRRLRLRILAEFPGSVHARARQRPCAGVCPSPVLACLVWKWVAPARWSARSPARKKAGPTLSSAARRRPFLWRPCPLLPAQGSPAVRVVSWSVRRARSGSPRVMLADQALLTP